MAIEFDWRSHFDDCNGETYYTCLPCSLVELLIEPSEAKGVLDVEVFTYDGSVKAWTCKSRDLVKAKALAEECARQWLKEKDIYAD